MYPRNIVFPRENSFFLFGPRGVGKTTLIKNRYPNATYIDLLDNNIYQRLLKYPSDLLKIQKVDKKEFIIIDEVQRTPELLNEVHRLIESPEHYKFILTGSSARKLRKQGVNLLAGRAFVYNLHPLSAVELDKDFNLQFSIKFGLLPKVLSAENPQKYLEAYVNTYLREEVQQEGLTRNLSAFSKFLEVSAFSNGSTINPSLIAQEIMIDRKVVTNYFTILDDLMLSHRLPIFNHRAKRKLISKDKFYYFDTGLYKVLKSMGPLDSGDEFAGIALENLFLQNLVAVNDSLDLGYKFYYYKTVSGLEVDFIAYGSKGFHAFEIKHARNITPKHLRNLKIFAKDYPEAKLHVFYLGDINLYLDNIVVHPFEEGLKNLSSILSTV